MSDGPAFDPTAPLTPTGNLRRRRAVSRLAESGATFAALAAVAVLAIIVYAIVSRGIGALSWEFLSTGTPTGIGPAILGSALIVLVATAIAMPIGILVALYVTQFAGARAAAQIRLVLDLLNGLPSIVIALFIFELIVVPTHNQSALAASVALAIIQLPLIARGSQEVLLLVPHSMREAADALGVSRWRTVLKVILPSALGGILTSTVLAVARAAGETAPVLLLCAVGDPRFFDGRVGEALPNIPVRIFILSEEGNPEGFTQAWGAGLVLVAGILLASLGARALLARSKRRMAQ